MARAWKNYLKRQPPEDLAAVKLLMKLAADKSNEVDIRVALLEAVGRAGKKGGLKTVSDQLVRILAEKDDPRIVGEAIKALALVKDPKAVTALAGAYRQYGDAGGAQTRALVCEALGEYYEKLAGMSLLGKQAAAKVTATLVAALNEDADAEVCSAAAFSLGNMDRRFDRTKAVASLIEALTDQSDKVRTSSLNSLKLMTDQDFGTDVERWRKWYRVNERSLRPRIR